MPPFLLGESHGAARMGLSRLLGLCAALLFASSVTAANIIDLGPSSYQNWGTGTNSHTGAGLRSSTGQTVRLPPLGGNLTVTRNAVIPYGSIANGARNFLRITPGSVAASAAITGLFIAVDWVFDQASGEWRREGHDTLEDDSLDLWCSAYGNCASTPEMACRDVIDLYPDQLGTWSYESVRSASSPATMLCYGTTPAFPNGELYAQVSINPAVNCPAPYQYNEELKVCTVPALVPLTDSDWSDLEAYLPVAAPNEVGQAGNDIQRQIGNPLPGFQDQTITGPSSVSGPSSTSTSIDPVTGDNVVTSTNTTTNISYGDTTITTTNTTTTTTYQNGQETSTTTTTETPGDLPVSSGGGEGGEWPGFCDWATVVCDWLNWTQEDPPSDQDLPPVVDDDFFEQKNISFGAKSCPPPHEVNLAPFLETTVGVSFQPLCDFAALIYYMVMAASYIIAAYISIGVARNA